MHNFTFLEDYLKLNAVVLYPCAITALFPGQKMNTASALFAVME